MTEPTHNMRPDAYAQIEMLAKRIAARLGADDVEVAWDILRNGLSDAWHHGWMTGYDDSNEHRRPSPNPYHETDIM